MVISCRKREFFDFDLQSVSCSFSWCFFFFFSLYRFSLLPKRAKGTALSINPLLVSSVVGLKLEFCFLNLLLIILDEIPGFGY